VNGEARVVFGEDRKRAVIPQQQQQQQQQQQEEEEEEEEEENRSVAKVKSSRGQEGQAARGSRFQCVAKLDFLRDCLLSPVGEL
jgi:hypothetical protein